MKTYQVELVVNGLRTQMTIRAGSPYDARRLAESQYAGRRVTILHCRLVG